MKAKFTEIVKIEPNIIYAYKRIRNDINGNPRVKGILYRYNDMFGYQVNINCAYQIPEKIQKYIKENKLYEE